jgi:histone deacetylase 11
VAVVVYSRHFAMGFPGMGKLHPFDGYRATRAYRLIKQGKIEFAAPTGPVTDAQLELVHGKAYLESLRHSAVLASALEVAILARCPLAFLDYILVTPMRWAVAGTLLAAREALRTGLAFNLAGGFHHAMPDRAEGFCLFNDIAFAIKTLALPKVLYVDLDAHQGNGVAACFAEDPSVQRFDIYNSRIYPRESWGGFAIEPGTDGPDYLELLSTELPPFLDRFAGADLLIYNAGSDVVMGDRLGQLGLSPAAVLQRDLLVIRQARRRKLPVLFLPSGGYTRQSYRLLADSVVGALASERQSMLA